jgi:homoserine O-succinyltransferase
MKLRVALLNMMPDTALIVTERQFGALLGANSGRELELLRYTFSALERGPKVADHLQKHYRDATELRAEDCDVLVITGANVSDPSLPRQTFWQPLVELLAWALAADLPVLCSCLATHAVLEARHRQTRVPVTPKVWGVFSHRLVVPGHPLLRGLPAEVPVPHSRHNAVDEAQFAAAGYEILLSNPEVGPHLAVEKQRGRWLLMQGHPEYETISLLKEYKREVGQWQTGQRPDFPVPPCGYLGDDALRMLASYESLCLGLGAGASGCPEFPEREIARTLANTWSAAAILVVANWLASLT